MRNALSYGWVNIALLLPSQPQPCVLSPETRALTVAQSMHNYGAHSYVISPQLTLRCRAKKDAPYEMARGSATTDSRYYAYFTPDNSYSVYSYKWSTKQWKELPSCPHSSSALGIIDGKLTTVGGWKSGFGCTNELLTLRRRQWVNDYPSMKTCRVRPAAVSASDGDYVIVIGGWDGNDKTTTVELFQVKTGQWYEQLLTNLPQPLPYPSATICGNQVHLIGGGGNGFSCSLQALPSSDKPIAPHSLRHLISWTPLPRLPVTRSTAVTISGQLVTFGGMRGESPVNSIHQLVEGKWVNIDAMTSSRWGCLSVSLSADRVMIVGGHGQESGTKRGVEECLVL